MPVERVREIAARDASLMSLDKVCENAFSLYKRTRPAASTESLKRARLLPKPGPHPQLVVMAKERLLGAVDAGSARADITNALKHFRPAATVLEAQARP